MGKIFYIMGKSSSGKDTICSRLQEEYSEIKKVILYTTRPIRSGEINGREYNFISEKELEEYENKGKLIEKRIYNTEFGNWIYATLDDGQFAFDKYNYIMIGTLESYNSMVSYFGKENIEPIYIFLESKERLLRAIERESTQSSPGYNELCRRYLADEKDFSEEKLIEAGIKNRYENKDLEECLSKIKKDIDRYIGR